MLFISFVLSGCTRLRGASRVIDTMLSFLELRQSVPSWYSGLLWLLRLGYYKLHREQEHADDWIWIVDHTVQLGSEKCLVILGIRQSKLPQAELYLNHEDVEPIALLPVTHSNGEIVFRQLTQTVEKTGLPREIVGDHGTDIKSGIERFRQDHEQTCYIYDIKHKGAAILKRELKDDQHWSTFIQLAAQTSKRVQQTRLSALAPPNQRSKARYMNVINWSNGGKRSFAIWICRNPSLTTDSPFSRLMISSVGLTNTVIILGDGRISLRLLKRRQTT